MQKKTYPKKKVMVRDLLFAIAFVILNLLVVVFLYREIILTTAFLILLTISFIVYYKSQILFPIFFFCMLGAVAEMFAISAGVWSYTISDIFGVPLWLFVLWGNTGLFIYEMSTWFERLGFRK